MTSVIAIHPGASYSTADVYNGIIPELRNLGVEVHEYDLESRLTLSGRFMDMVWRQRGRPKDAKYSQADVIYKASIEALERALRYEVDGVLVFSGMFCHPDLLVLLRRAHIRTAILLSESPYDDERQARTVLPWVDVAWTNERSSVKFLRQTNPNVNYMPHGFNPAVHHPEAGPDESEVPAHDVVFVGSLFAERVDLLAQVDWTGIDLGLYGEWSGLPSRHKLRKFLAGDVVDNRYAAALYRKAKIGLNLYRESIGWGKYAPRISHAESMNPRTLELAACGCFQISQARDEITEVFGTAVPTFKTVDGLTEQLWYALEHPAERQKRAQRALAAVQPQTFAARAQTIVADLGRAGWPMPESVPQLVAV